MDKKYLKSLQERAQRLLEISSDEGSDHQSFNLTKVKSRKATLNEAISGANANQLKLQFEDYRNTDVQLLKKCISITNQNTQLKRQVKSIQTENSKLIEQISFLQKQLQNFKTQLLKFNEKEDIQHHGPLSPYNRLKQNNHFSFVDRNSFEGPKQKSQSFYKFQSSKQTKVEESTNFRDIQKIEQRYCKQISELEQRLKVANQKKQSIQQVLLKQKEKSRKLCKFINQEIPGLKDIVTSLTNKVDVHVESILLKDINQNQIEANFTKRNKTIGRKAY